MPFVFDFKPYLSEIHTVDVSPKGWKSTVTVEYIIAQAHRYDPVVSVVWRVKGTSHCFTIGEQRINLISNGNYKKHFTETLENFRKDYLSWFKDEEYRNAEWKYEYERQFGRFIESEDSEGQN